MKNNQKQRKNAGSTQKFTEIVDINEDIVLLTGGNACLAIEVQATNFALLSKEEQATKIASYASVLNSLTFPIQIVIRNKRVDITAYLKLLEIEAQKTQNPKLALQINLYREFIQEVVKVNTVLDKNFYIVIPYSPLEKSASQALKKSDQFATARAALHAKAETLLGQFARLALKAKVLDKQSLIHLFYEIYNENVDASLNIEEVYKTPVVKAAPNQTQV